MKKVILAVISLIALSGRPIYAIAEDNSRLGYVSLSAYADANFSDNVKSFSSDSGGGLSVMFHKWGDYRGKQVVFYDFGIDYSHFNGKMSNDITPKDSFSLNNFIANARIALAPVAYFEGGYGLSVLDEDDVTVGGCWKWGFGANFNLAKNLYMEIEISRWDGPGPVGFWSPSLGMAYHF